MTAWAWVDLGFHTIVDLIDLYDGCLLRHGPRQNSISLQPSRPVDSALRVHQSSIHESPGCCGRVAFGSLLFLASQRWRVSWIIQRLRLLTCVCVDIARGSEIA